MFVPADASAVLSGVSPRHIRSGDFDAAVEFTSGMASDVREYTLGMQSAHLDLSSSSSVATAELDARVVDGLIPGALTLHRSAEDSRKGFLVFVTECGRIDRDASGVETIVEEALAAIRTNATSIAEICERIHVANDYQWDDNPPGVMPTPMLGPAGRDLTSAEAGAAVQHLNARYEYEWLTAASAWHAALDAIAEANVTWARLVEDRKQAESRLARELERTDLGQLITLSGAETPRRASVIARAVAGDNPDAEFTSASTSIGRALLKRLLGSATGGNTWEAPPEPQRVAREWEGLSAKERERLIAEAPDAIGNLPGIPFADRDQANRGLLAHLVVQQATLGVDSQTALDEVMRVMAADNGDPPVHLVALKLDGEVPMVAVAYGDADHADNVTWEVPGMLNDAHRGLPGWDTASKNLYAEQEQVLDLSGRAHETIAVIAFLEYDTPDPVTVLLPDAAREGATRLTAELDGTRAVRGSVAPLPNLGVLAHSYGTTTASIALLHTAEDVQSFTMIGSAGLDASSVHDLSDLHVARGADGAAQVYTSIASADGLAPFGSNASQRLQPNPTAAARTELVIEGAQSFSSEGRGNLTGTAGHSIIREDGQGYLDRGTQALRNVAALSVGSSGEVSGELQ